MDKMDLILLKAMLKASSLKNISKYTKDKKKKKQITGNYVGLAIIYTMLLAYSLLMGIGYGSIGLSASIPGMCALILSTIAFFFTLLKTNGYLFNFKEYDVLMSLPFAPKTIARDKFIYMYIKSLPWYLSISFAMMISFCIYAKPSIIVYPIWIVLTFFIPIIPMLAAAFIGFVIAKISSGFRKTNIVQTILTFVLVIFCFSLRYIIDAIVKNDALEATIENIANIVDKTGEYYPPINWFAGSINLLRVSDILMLLGVSILLFELIFWYVGKSYRQINSALKSHAASKAYKMSGHKKKTVIQTIAFKEFKRMLGSTLYLTNVGLGELFAAIFGVLVLIMGFDKIVAVVTQDAPFSASIVYPAIPLIIYFFIGMVATTVCSPSLEGKNYWIVQSLPITKKQLYQGKMYFNMCLTIPFMTFAIVCAAISCKVSVLVGIIYVLEGAALCAVSTTWGCVCGIKHIRLDWENEAEVVKQGSAVAIYLLPNMFITMGLMVGVVALGFVINPILIAIIITIVVSLLAFLFYNKAIKLAERS